MKRMFRGKEFRRGFIVIFLFLILIVDTRGQQLPVFNHYYLNQYLYNPAMVGTNGYAEVYFINRQQWRGIEGAPVTSSLTLHLPTSGNFSFGLNFHTDKYGVLSTTNGLVTTAYTVHLTPESSLRGGVSVGVGRQSLDVAALESGDVTVLSASSYIPNNAYLDGNAGINYQWKNLNVGFALPQIFQRDVLTSESFNKVKVGQLNYQLFLASYKFFASPHIKIEPQVNYRLAKQIPNQFEILTTAYYDDKIWFGASYRQSYGPAFYLGGVIKDIIKIGYAYEIASAQVSGFSNASHEVMISLRIGKKKINKKMAAQKEPTNAVAEDDIKDDEEAEKNQGTADKEDHSDPRSGKNKNAVARQNQNQDVPLQGDLTPKTPLLETSVPSTSVTIVAPDATINKPVQKAAEASTSVQNNTGKNETAARVSPKKEIPVMKDQVIQSAVNEPKAANAINASDAKAGLSIPEKTVTSDGRVITVDKPTINNGEEKLKSNLKGSNDIEIKKGNYIVVRAFRVFDNAVKYTRKLNNQGLAATCQFSSKSLFYYVYLLKSGDIEQARRERDILRKQDQFSDAWLLSVEE